MLLHVIGGREAGSEQGRKVDWARSHAGLLQRLQRWLLFIRWGRAQNWMKVALIVAYSLFIFPTTLQT